MPMPRTTLLAPRTLIALMMVLASTALPLGLLPMYSFDVDSSR